jgi:hypothetical protein
MQRTNDMITKENNVNNQLDQKISTQETNERYVLLEVGVIKNKRVGGPGSLKSRPLLVASSL